MKILEDKTVQGSPIKVPLEYRCPHCDSLLLIEEGDYRKDFDWVYSSYGKPKKCYCYVANCPCCGEEFKLTEYEYI